MLTGSISKSSCSDRRSDKGVARGVAGQVERRDDTYVSRCKWIECKNFAPIGLHRAVDVDLVDGRFFAFRTVTTAAMPEPVEELGGVVKREDTVEIRWDFKATV